MYYLRKNLENLTREAFWNVSYSVSDEAVEEFDMKFSPKIKEKRPGQFV